jgi:hypothetical protein
MSEAQSLQAAHDLIDALKVTKGGASDDEIRNIVTGGITNDRDVLLDELRYQLEHGRFYDANVRRALVGNAPPKHRGGSSAPVGGTATLSSPLPAST